jgi:hypothetical protein
LKRIIRTVREDCHNSVAHVFNNKSLEGSDDRTDLFIIAIIQNQTRCRSILGFGSDERITFAGIGKPDTLTIKNAQGRPVWDLESYKAYISLDKPAVRDANDTMIKNNRNAKSGEREMNGEY